MESAEGRDIVINVDQLMSKHALNWSVSTVDFREDLLLSYKV